VGVAGDDQADTRVEALDDVDDRAGEVVAVETPGVGRARTLRAALVHQQHLRLDAEQLEHVAPLVRGLDLVGEVHVLDAGRVDDAGVPSSVRPTKPTGTPPTNLMSIGGRIGRPVLLLIVFAAR
jgi:hypothetical protein